MAVEMVLDVVLTSKYCTATRIRWGDVLRKLLRNLRKTLTVTVSWRDIYHAMCQCADAPAQAYTGLHAIPRFIACLIGADFCV